MGVGVETGPQIQQDIMIEFEHNNTSQDDIMSDLGFCCCGRPSDALEYIRQGLLFIEGGRQESESYDEYLKRTADTFGSEAAGTFFFYWADKESLTEHGGSIPGWLEFRGYELLHKLNQLAQGTLDDGTHTQTSNSQTN